MSTDNTDIPVILVAFPEDMTDQYQNEYMTQALNKQVLPLVALLPDDTSPLPALDGNKYNQEWYSVIRNTGSLNALLFRAHATDILQAHSNLLVVAVIEFDHRFAMAWDLPQLQQ